MDYFEFEKFKGMTFNEIYIGKYEGNDAIYFRCKNGEQYVMTHLQDCCEDVYLADVTGSFDDIVGSEIYRAFVNTNSEEGEFIHSTYTFYTLATFKGAVTFRWNGTSNGYYSESCDVYKSEP